MQPGKRLSIILVLIVLLCFLSSPVANANQGNEQLLEKLESLQQQIDELKLQLTQTQNHSNETDAKLEAVAEVIESGPAEHTEVGKTSIGGYGELHYNNIKASDNANDAENIDFHRFVLFFNHSFDDKTRFYSEFELEHSNLADSGGNSPGAVELEQAYIEFDLQKQRHAKLGLFLMPVGVLNETHEPPTFYGVERNDVENIIIPSTWWEAGGALNGRLGSDWSWDLVASSGLQIPTTGKNAFRVRSGRQNVAEARASDGAITGRLRYFGIPGLLASLSLQYQFDPSQLSGDGLDSGTLVDANVAYTRGKFGLRALYSRWDFSGDAVKAADADQQWGWYFEPSYLLSKTLGFYARYENLQGARLTDKFEQWEVGANWWLNKNVVVKIDYRNRDHKQMSENARNFTAIDLGVGYSF